MFCDIDKYGDQLTELYPRPKVAAEFKRKFHYPWTFSIYRQSCPRLNLTPVCGVSRRDRVPSAELRERMGIELVSDIVKWSKDVLQIKWIKICTCTVKNRLLEFHAQ